MKNIAGFKACVRCSALLSLFIFASAVCLAQKPELVVQTGHSNVVISVAFSPDGKLLASGSDDNTIKVWEVKTGRQLRSLVGHSLGVRSVAFAKDGKTLASGSWDYRIIVWNADTGERLRTLVGHTNAVHSVAFSADGKFLASASEDRTIKLWEVAKARLLKTFRGPEEQMIGSVVFSADGKMLISSSTNSIRLWDVGDGRMKLAFENVGVVNQVALSPDGKMLAGAHGDKTLKLWEVATGRVLRTLSGHTEVPLSVAFNSDGKTLASGSHDRTARLWDAATGRELYTFTGHSEVRSVAFGPDGRTLASGNSDRTVRLWDTDTKRELRTLSGRSNWSTQAIAFSDDGKTLVSAGKDHTIKVWRLTPGGDFKTLKGHSSPVNSVAISPDGKTFATGSSDKMIKLWEAATGRELQTLTWHSDILTSLAFSADSNTLAGGGGKTITLWEVATGRELRTLAGHSDLVYSIALSPDGKTLASGSWDGAIKLWEFATGRELHTFSPESSYVYSVAFSADGKTLATCGWGETIKLWDVATGRELRNLAGHTSSVLSVAFSPDGRVLSSGSWDQTIKLWEVATGRELRTLTGLFSPISLVKFSPDGGFLVSASGDTVNVWRVVDGQLLASLVALDETDWAVVTPEGRFDASPDAQKLMHWMVGSEVIQLEQLKQRYYEPGLLAKLMGFSKEPLRDVRSFQDPKLYPEVKYEPPAKGSSTLVVNLTNSGGGIGRVQVFINDKEYLNDARDEKLKQNPNVSHAKLNIDLSRAPGTVTGEENKIRVQAWNVENYISSRGEEKPWVAPGPTNKEPPEVYAIVGGISQYASPSLKLPFAGRDAVAIANAIELGAKRLFGADKVHLSLLSTADDQRAIAPTKENFTRAFAAARRAKPGDILIVYLAGHGITLQRGTDTYCYLTQEARTTDSAALSDTAVRQQQTITSEELVEWIKQIPAKKQAVILDTCAAGAAKAKLNLMDKRDASGDAIRAIDRAKERSGSHILMGSAADAVSYEASIYGQGLLTYALLKGLKGPALNYDEFVDISKLFLYAREEVPLLATNIGGIQKPIIFAPNQETFDVGQLKIEDKQKIVLAAPKPMILRPIFLEAPALADTLDLMKTLRGLLRDESFVTARGEGDPALVFVDDEEFPGGIRPTGTYTVAGSTVTVALRLRRDGVEIFGATVSGTKQQIAAKVVEAIKAAIAKMSQKPSEGD